MRRPLPHDLDAERAVLSACLLKRSALDSCLGVVRPEHFFREEHQRYWAAFVALSEDGTPLDVATVAAWMRAHGGIARLADLAEVCDATPAVHNVEHHARIIRDLARMRAVITEALRVDEIGRDPDSAADVQGFLDGVATRMAAIAEEERDSSMVTFAEVVSQEFDAISAAARAGSPMVGFPSDFPRLNEHTGGYQPGEVYYVGGRPGMGKSIYLLQECMSIASSSAANVVGMFSAEMGRSAMVRRGLSALARVDSKQLKTGDLDAEDWRYLTQAARDLSSLAISIDDSSAPSPIAIRAKARKLAAKAEAVGKRLAAIAVDYVQLLSPIGLVGPRASRQQEVGAISKSLVKLAKELRVPVIACAQLNRPKTSGVPDPPQLTDLREAGDLEQDADGVIFIHREEYYLTGRVPPEKKGHADIILAKYRNGSTGSFPLTFDGRYSRFQNPGATL